MKTITSARDLMTPTVVTIASNTPFLEILHMFVVANITGAPVVDEAGAVIGMISARELLLAVDQACDDEIDDAPADRERSIRSTREPELPLLLRSGTARDLAVPEIVWVAPDASISSVAETMRAKGVGRVLVGQPGQLAGIVTMFDLLAAITS